MSNQSKGRPGGVLPIPVVATKKPNVQPTKSVQRSPAPRLRLIIRRLPPGLIETEFWEALGPEWQDSNGKVDWHAFKEGKISKDPSKPSRPGRAYLKVKDQSLLEALSAKIKATPFKDAKNTGGDTCLVGPPSLEFAPYSKVPSGRNRHDGRQGTIDQDQEFIDFLQSLTEPITKSILNGAEGGDVKPEKAGITPLVQFIKEKKANKAKEKEAAAAAKSSKKGQENKDTKTKSETRPTVVVKTTSVTADKARVTKATQEAVKAANKTAAQIQNKSSASKSEPKSAKEQSSTTSTPTKATVEAPSSAPVSTPKAERQRGSASAVSRMIARDLGLAPKEPRAPRAARNASTTRASTTPAATESAPKVDVHQKAVSTPANSTKAAPTAAAPSSSSVNVPSQPAQAQAPPTGPKNARANQTPPTKPAQVPVQRTNKAPAQPSPGAKSAFLKHANPSQGVTEDLLRTIFSTFGEVVRCEIDKKKGLGYVDFTDTDALKSAMAVSPIKVGNGQVVVLENRSPYNKRQGQPGNIAQQQTATGTSKSRAPSVASSVVASAVTSPQPSPAVIATAEPTKVAIALEITNASAKVPPATANATPSSTSSATSSAAPTAPKGSRNASAAGRGGRGGGPAQGRSGPTVASGAAQSPNRGRGGYRGRGGRGSRAGGSGTATTGTNSSPAPSGAGQAATSETVKPVAAEQT